MTAFDTWLSGPYDVPTWTVEAETAYDLYLEAHEQEARRDFDEGCHDCVTLEEFMALDPPIDFDDFAEKWHDEQEELAREMRWSHLSHRI